MLSTLLNKTFPSFLPSSQFPSVQILWHKFLKLTLYQMNYILPLWSTQRCQKFCPACFGLLINLIILNKIFYKHHLYMTHHTMSECSTTKLHPAFCLKQISVSYYNVWNMWLHWNVQLKLRWITVEQQLKIPRQNTLLNWIISM